MSEFMDSTTHHLGSKAVQLGLIFLHQGCLIRAAKIQMSDAWERLVGGFLICFGPIFHKQFQFMANIKTAKSGGDLKPSVMMICSNYSTAPPTNELTSAAQITEKPKNHPPFYDQFLLCRLQYGVSDLETRGPKLQTKGKNQTIHRKMIIGFFYWWQITCKLQGGYSLFLIQRTEGTSIHHWSCHTALLYSMHKPLKPHPTNLFTTLPSFLKTHVTSSSLQECGT